MPSKMPIAEYWQNPGSSWCLGGAPYVVNRGYRRGNVSRGRYLNLHVNI